jgi:hypothetical protein
MTDWKPATPPQTFQIGLQYYVSGRAAWDRNHFQVAGNLFHHGFGGVFTMWNDHLRRAHESQVRKDDRGHDREMQALADKRAKRDHRGEGIYANVHSILELVASVGDEVQRLRTRPQDYLSGGDAITTAIDNIKKIRPSLLIDPETSKLFHQVDGAVNELNLFWIALDTRASVKSAQVERLAEYRKQVHDLAAAVTQKLDDIVIEARQVVAKTEAALE